MTKAFITGCAGPALTPQERTFFADQDPWGLILFARNCEDRDQIRALVEDFRTVVGREDAPVLIDQEGGRVQRLSPPHWPTYPSAANLVASANGDEQALKRLAYVHGRLIAADLLELGITIDCLPVLDIRLPETHAVIGDRSFGGDPDQVSRVALRQTDGLMDGGVLPIMKHIPGHGRAGVDSHDELPRVDASLDELRQSDFRPFRLLASQIPMAMTAHIVYTALDPERPATTSSKIVQDVIRSEIGFDGLLMTDDLSMKALSGSFGERTRLAFAAGCDIALHCNGDMDEMTAVAAATPTLTGQAARRAEAALAARRAADGVDIVALRGHLDSVVSSTA